MKPRLFSAIGLAASVILGTVESVRVVPVESDVHAYEPAFELRLRPDMADELDILLDDGRAVTIRARDTQRFTAGERVRVQSHTYSPFGPRVEHE